MKKLKKIVAVSLAGMMLLTGCGASFDVSSSALETYADEQSGVYADVTDNYSEYDYVEGVYVAETDGAHVELWDFNNAEYAGGWFTNNVESTKTMAASHSGSSNSEGGDYSFNVDGTYYRILFSGDKGIYAYGTKENVNQALSSMGIVK